MIMLASILFASMDASQLTFSIGTLIVIIGAVVTVVTFFRNYKKDSVSSIAADTQLRSDVDQLKKELDSIKEDYKSIRIDFRTELTHLDSQVIERMNLMDSKLDGIKNILIEKLNK